MEPCPLSPDNTPKGTLPPFEVAKAYAFEKVLSHMAKCMGKSLWQLIGEDKGDFIAKHLVLKGGGRPSRSSVFKVIKKCGENGWHPGKVTGQRTGRKPTFTQHQKDEAIGEAYARWGARKVPSPESQPGDQSPSFGLDDL